MLVGGGVQPPEELESPGLRGGCEREERQVRLLAPCCRGRGEGIFGGVPVAGEGPLRSASTTIVERAAAAGSARMSSATRCRAPVSSGSCARTFARTLSVSMAGKPSMGPVRAPAGIDDTGEALTAVCTAVVSSSRGVMSLPFSKVP